MQAARKQDTLKYTTIGGGLSERSEKDLPGDAECCTQKSRLNYKQCPTMCPSGSILLTGETSNGVAEPVLNGNQSLLMLLYIKRTNAIDETNPTEARMRNSA